MAVRQHFIIDLPMPDESWMEVTLTREQAVDVFEEMARALYPEQFTATPQVDEWDENGLGGGVPWDEPTNGSPAVYDSSTQMTVEEAEKKLAEQQALSPPTRLKSGSGIGNRAV